MIRLALSRAPRARPSQAARLARLSPPPFACHAPDLGALARAASLHRRAKKVLVLGNGGSRTSFLALYGALEDRAARPAGVLHSPDPWAVARARARFPPQETVAVAVSRSGATLSVLEALLALQDYRVHAVTLPRPSPLRALCRARGWPVLDHAPLGGRFSGLTATALFPAALCGLSTRAIWKGARALYAACHPRVPVRDNPAKRLALFLHACERKGLVEVFAGVYSARLARALPLLVQLVHESYGKNGRGQTLFGDEGPEAQHHTLQRVLGGRRNVCALLVDVARRARDRALRAPPALRAAPPFRALHGATLSRALRAELEGTRRALARARVPTATLSLEQVSPAGAGAFLALLQYQAFYGARLRGVNPFNQPHVEAGKRFTRALLERQARAQKAKQNKKAARARGGKGARQ